MARNEYIQKYREIYKGIPEKNRKKSEEIIDKLADVLMMMDECKLNLDAEGLVTEMCQGKYSISRENPWSHVYDQKAKLMVTLLDKLDKMLPDQKSESVSVAGENLAKLVAGGKPIELR